MKNKCKPVAILLMLSVISAMLPGCRPASAAADTFTPERLKQAIDLAASYIVRNCDANGRFTYIANIKPGVKVKPGYNIIRHAGAIYALCMYEEYRLAMTQKENGLLRRSTPRNDDLDEKTRQAIRRAAGYLKRERVAALKGKPEISAVWQEDAATPHALLGGAGLGLAALMSAEKILPGTTPIKELRKLGRFLLFMQKQDGRFYSSYIPSLKEGRSDNWPSLYFPGESCLGLLMLYEKDPQIEWLQGAANAISYLVLSRENTGRTQKDYWALIAIAELLKYYGDCQQPVSSAAILQHAAAICGNVLSSAKNNFATYPGCFSGDRRTTPTSAGLEGLLAALAYLPEKYKSLKQSIAPIVKAGAEFILTGQVMAGEYSGGFLFKAPGKKPEDKTVTAESDSEIRIDYVQHALCALLRYQKLFH